MQLWKKLSKIIRQNSTNNGFHPWFAYASQLTKYLTESETPKMRPCVTPLPTERPTKNHTKTPTESLDKISIISFGNKRLTNADKNDNQHISMTNWDTHILALSHTHTETSPSILQNRATKQCQRSQNTNKSAIENMAPKISTLPLLLPMVISCEHRHTHHRATQSI